MNNLKHIIGYAALLIAMLGTVDAYSQPLKDTLDEVKIRAKRKLNVSNDDRINTFSPGQKVLSIDSLTLQQYQFQNIGNLLSQQVPVFVKSYGFNALATLNFRGASAAQSQVYWNGVPLQNAALGISDVSLLPVSLMNKVNIVYGGSSALWGSGNVGGALLLENDPAHFDSAGSAEYAVSAAAGSYGQYQLGLKTAMHTKRWSVGVNAFGQTAQNDFRYTDNRIIYNTLNSKLQSGVVMANAAYKVNNKNTIGFIAWYQQYYREIPKAIFESVSFKNQRDESLRLLADWNRTATRTHTYARVSYIRDYMRYTDNSILLKSDNTTNQLFTEAGVKYRFNEHHQLLVFTPVQIAWIEGQLLKEVKTQNKAALAAAYAVNYFRQKLNVSLNMRGEVINQLSILLPGINASYAVTDWLLIRANAQRSFRAPTLNELYYNPGGNDKLKPEKGWTQDAGYSLKTNNKHKLSLSHDASVFNRLIDDWIIWFGGAIWTPHNIATVHSRGIETENMLHWNVNKDWKLHLGLNTSYIIATTQSSYQYNDGSIGKQIPYTPRYIDQANIGFTYKSLYFNYNHVYTGYRFVTTDESQWLLPYHTGNIQLLYGFDVKTVGLQLTAQCNNVLNNSYSIVNARPMPGINWLAGVKASF